MKSSFFQRNLEGSSVLIINEDAELNKLIYSSLKDDKYELTISENAEEGVTYLYSKKIDLVLLGTITTEGLGVTELLKRVTSNPETMRLPVMVLLPEEERELGIKALSSGAIDYLVTPFNELEFTTKIGNFISMKLLSESFEDQLKEEELIKQQIKELEVFKAFVVTANHEINQPLAIIRGNLDLFSMINPDVVKKNEKYIGKINTSMSKISKILNRMKEIDKPEFTGYTDTTVMIDIGKLD